MPLLVAAALLSLIGACGLVVSFDYGPVGGDVPDARLLYAVEGSVLGLEGSTVTLALNDLRLTVGDGPFAFPAALPDGSAFVVSVAEHPFNHPCSLFHATGAIAGEDEKTVLVSCPSDDAKLASLSIDLCFGGSSCTARIEPVTLAFVPSKLAYQVVVAESYSVMRVRARTIEHAASVKLQDSGTYDPQTDTTALTSFKEPPFTLGIDVTAPDRTTVLHYAVAVTPDAGSP